MDPHVSLILTNAPLSSDSTHCLFCCAHYQLLHKRGHCYVIHHNTLHTHIALVGMGTTTDSADLQSDWHAQIPPRVVNWTKLLA